MINKYGGLRVQLSPEEWGTIKQPGKSPSELAQDVAQGLLRSARVLKHAPELDNSSQLVADSFAIQINSPLGIDLTSRLAGYIRKATTYLRLEEKLGRSLNDLMYSNVSKRIYKLAVEESRRTKDEHPIIKAMKASRKELAPVRTTDKKRGLEF